MSAEHDCKAAESTFAEARLQSCVAHRGLLKTCGIITHGIELMFRLISRLFERIKPVW
ncbi:hypothetical protein HMPREF1584_01469 [Gardnerella vaginalis JCP8481A]|nr:hypothetical protein HMPREF1584_01469 [Gardnerella vaginalis JCP8481A]EPI41257.1 hypothetical protein HMPREF1585_01269 [Gardnerella vaginalis JCP8481B]